MARTSIHQTGAGLSRVARAARGLPSERRLAAIAAVGLFLTLFLPWYQETVVARSLKTGSEMLTGWGAFSWVEAAVLLVSAVVLTLLFQRAEGRAFHVPGGDGGVITAAGAWTGVLVIWRIFDKQGVSRQGIYAASSGIEWGIFIALAMAALLAYAGTRIRAAHQPEPALPGEGDSGPRETPDPIARPERDRPDSRRRERRFPSEPVGPTSREAQPRPHRPVPERAADASPGRGPLSRLFDDRPPAFERPEWSGSAIGAFEPRARRNESEAATNRVSSEDAPDPTEHLDEPATRHQDPEPDTRRNEPDPANRFPRPVAADQPPPDERPRR